ncbi:hypothetical protein TNCV_831021 [Trichonephila clavipes]|nr:hypothetical protein TNCV_831021 [Trichonephila clavipes]
MSRLKRSLVGVVWKRTVCQLRCRPRHLTMVQNCEVRRQKPSCCCILLVGFWRRPRRFEPWLSDEDDTSACTPSPNYHNIPLGVRSQSRACRCAGRCDIPMKSLRIS